MQHVPRVTAPLSIPTSVEASSHENIVLLPLAITRVDATSGCVSGLTQDGRWLRPEPVRIDDIAGENPCYTYGHPIQCRVGPSCRSDRRPEDRELFERMPVESEFSNWRGVALEQWLLKQSDVDASSCFAGERSVGIIRALPQGLSLLRWTQGRYLLRLEFSDASEQRYNWIVSDFAFCDQVISILLQEKDQEKSTIQIIESLRASNLFLSLVLTKPVNKSRRDLIRGCQPLVAGVHTFPHYRATLFPDERETATFERSRT